jgi:hypothetical protein
MDILPTDCNFAILAVTAGFLVSTFKTTEGNC